MIDNSNDFLQHYGVKGMRWGVKRTQQTKDRPERFTKSQKRGLVVATTLLASVGAMKFKQTQALKPYDYGYTYPTTDIGPMGLRNFRFGK